MNGCTKVAVEDLSRSRDHYLEDIDCQKSCYDFPQLIHHAHIRNINESPSLKDSNSMELRKVARHISRTYACFEIHEM